MKNIIQLNAEKEGSISLQQIWTATFIDFIHICEISIRKIKRENNNYLHNQITISKPNHLIII
jgi:hypothetical protein